MVLSNEERLRLADIDPELSEYLQSTPIPQLDTSDAPKAIANLRWYMQSLHLQDPDQGVLERDIYYSNRHSHSLRAHVYEPSIRSETPEPLVVYIHGGGWTIGSPEDAERSCRDIVRNLGVDCVAPSYRQGPEDPFPADITDVWDGVQWIAGHAEAELHVSLTRGFIIGGSSAGGNMAAIVSHLARDEELNPAITGVFLLAPMILPPEAEESLPKKYREMYISRNQPECMTIQFLPLHWIRYSASLLLEKHRRLSLFRLYGQLVTTIFPKPTFKSAGWISYEMRT